MTPGRIAATIGTCLVLVVILAGCTPSVVGGHAHRDPAFTSGSAIPAVLAPGNYRTTPLPAFGTADQEGRNGAVIEAQRMAAYVVGPWEVDPTLLESVVTETMVLKNATSLAALLPDPVQFLAAQHRFMIGFSSDRTSAPSADGNFSALTNSVWRFPTAEDAQAAAQDISQQAPTLPAQDQLTARAIAGHPQAIARAITLDAGTATVESFTPHANYVIYNYSRIKGGDIDAAAALITKSLDLQLPRIDEFKATDPAQFGALPVDPTGVLTRTLPMLQENLTVQNGVYEPRAALHFEADPITSAKLFAETDMQTQGVGDATAVYQTRDATTAKQLFDGLVNHATEPTDTTDSADSPRVNGLPSAVCSGKGDNGVYQCMLTASRYVAVVLATRPEEIRQKTAAQYLMLTAP